MKIFQGMTVYSEEGVLENASIVIKNGKIESFSSKKFPQDEVISFPSNYHLVPGFIDLHIHGGFGVDVMDGSQKALQTLCEKLPKEGTTSFLATTLSQDPKKIEKALVQTKTFIKNPLGLGAEILGIHLEGPFICTEKCGSHLPEWVIEPNLALLKKWIKLSCEKIKIVTLAPEKKGAFALIENLKHQQIIPAIGHTNATYEETLQAIKKGCLYATHIFNAMTPLHHRNPGCALACLLHPDVIVEMIADFIHLHPAILDMIYRLKTSEKTVLITDAMRAKDLGEGTYEFGGQEVIVKGNKAMLENQTIAGSVLKMIEAIKNVYPLALSIEKIVQMCSFNPAKLLKVDDRKGSIRKNKDADLVVLDEKLNVVMTLCKGEIVYSQSSFSVKK